MFLFQALRHLNIQQERPHNYFIYGKQTSLSFVYPNISQPRSKKTLDINYFKRRLKPEDIDEAITLVSEECTIISITTPVKGVATHPEDDLVISAAISGKADYLVTGDQPLLNKVGNSYRGVTLTTPNDFLKILQ